MLVGLFYHTIIIYVAQMHMCTQVRVCLSHFAYIYCGGSSNVLLHVVLVPQYMNLVNGMRFVVVCYVLVHLNFTISWWRHQVETFSPLLALFCGNSSFTGEFPSQRPVTQGVMFSLICQNKQLINNCDASYWRRHRVRYDVTEMSYGVALLPPGQQSNTEHMGKLGGVSKTLMSS